MELRHRILQFNNSPKFNLLKNELESLGCNYLFKENQSLSSIEYTVSENDPLFKTLLSFSKAHDLYVQSALYYSEEDIDNAEWVVCEVGEFQYPQPEENYKEVTYDLSNYCRSCGIGKIQNSPFRLKKDFTQKKLKLFGLHWVFDEIFVRSDIVKLFEKEGISGISFTDVIHHKTDSVIDNLYQMKVNTIIEPGLNTDNLFKVTCKSQNEESYIKGLGQIKDKPGYTFCGRVKYRYPLTEPLQCKASILQDQPDFVKSYEYYGSGLSAQRFILARKRIVRLLRDNKIRGLGFRRPVHLV